MKIAKNYTIARRARNSILAQACGNRKLSLVLISYSRPIIHSNQSSLSVSCAPKIKAIKLPSKSLRQKTLSMADKPRPAYKISGKYKHILNTPYKMSAAP